MKFVIKYPHTVICLIIHLTVCVFLFENLLLMIQAITIVVKSLLAELHLLAQYFAKMLCFTVT
jgi:hypothetical protein